MGTLASNAGSNYEVIATDIHKRKDKLCSLKHNGKTLKIALGKVLLSILINLIFHSYSNNFP